MVHPTLSHLKNLQKPNVEKVENDGIFTRTRDASIVEADAMFITFVADDAELSRVQIVESVSGKPGGVEIAVFKTQVQSPGDYISE